MQKDGKVTYSTDMCVRDRLEGLKRDNPEGYQYAISNIVLAKRVLKEEGLYKKASSPGATEYGGFGGVGVENWILENGGSFAKAMDTFIETANKSQGFDDFKADPDGCLAILMNNQNEENFPLTQSVEEQSCATLIPLMETEDAAFLTQIDECWQENIDWMLENQLIDKAVDVSDVMTIVDFEN